MTDYSKPDYQYLANMIYEHIENQQKINPWNYSEKGVEINYSDWPLKVEDLVSSETIEFDEEELCYHIDAFREVDVEGYEIRSRNSTGGDYVNFSQILAIRGEIGLEHSGNELVFDPNSTDLEHEISFDLKGGSSYSGETPPF